MHIDILSHANADIDLITHCLPEHTCQRQIASKPWHRNLGLPPPQMLIVDIEAAGLQMTDLVQQTSSAPQLPLLLLATDDPATLTSLLSLPRKRLIAVEFKPLRAHAIAAHVKLLLQRAYPHHETQQWQQFDDYRFERPSFLVQHHGRTIILTQKEFMLATLFFNHIGRPLSRAYLKEAVWGREEENEVPMRTLDTHISRIRTKLNLRPDNGYRLGTVYGYGYELLRLEATAAQ